MNSWRDNVRKVEPYTPGEQPKEGVIKLNTNENPYPPSDKIKEAMSGIKNLRKYPDPAATKLVEAIASYHGFDKEEVFVGVGSDDVLAVAFMTFFNGKKPIFFPDITYSFYPVWAELFGIPYEKKAVNDAFEIQKEDYYAENGGVVFPNPNAPTGAFLSLDVVEDIIKHNQNVVVIVDEAYIDFGGVSAKDLVNEYDNVLVVQTFSKSRSMAGMRIGYAFGSKELIKALNDVKFSFNSYTMNMTSIDMGVASINDKKYFEECVERITATRERTKEELTKLGFTFTDSKANFIFATHKSVPAKEIFENARNLDVCVLVFTLDCCYIFHADEDEIQRKIAQKAKFKVIEDYDIDFLKDEKIAKILYEKRDMDYLKQLAKKLPESIQETCSIAFSSGRYLEMNTKGVDKGYGMRWLVNYLGYDMDETIGIGDNYNDVEMIKTAKLGCAVACASDDIKELAQYVTQKDYDEGAVKEVIEKFVLGENHE